MLRRATKARPCLQGWIFHSSSGPGPKGGNVRPLLLAVALVLFGRGMVFPSGSQADSPDARAIVQKGTVEAGLAAGYLQGLKVFTSDSSNRSAVYVLPRIGMVLTSEIGKGWYGGNLELLLEPLYARYFHPF